MIKTYRCDRVLFGTDYPMWLPENEVDSCLSLGFTDEEYELIFHKNAERVFGCTNE